MSQRIIAVIETDEDVLLKAFDDGIGCAFEKEMKALEPKGISVANWVIRDYDDEPYEAYLRYLIDWALEQNPEKRENGKQPESPPTYEAWLEAVKNGTRL